MELLRKKDSRFYWYDFKVRGKWYRGSTKETNKKRAGRIAALRFSQAIEGTGLLDRKAPSLQELSTRFRGWVESAGLASKTRKYYANGWRLLSSTSIVGMRLDHITKDHVEVLRFGGSRRPNLKGLISGVQKGRLRMVCLPIPPLPPLKSTT